ncbi:hypothetical protein AB4144_26040, partial [Rhizobiaceae sp. 2RAB30]
ARAIPRSHIGGAGRQPHHGDAAPSTRPPLGATGKTSLDGFNGRQHQDSGTRTAAMGLHTQLCPGTII